METWKTNGLVDRSFHCSRVTSNESYYCILATVSHMSDCNTVGGNLGSLYAIRGKMAEAEKTYQPTLDKKQKAYGLAMSRS